MKSEIYSNQMIKDCRNGRISVIFVNTRNKEKCDEINTHFFVLSNICNVPFGHGNNILPLNLNVTLFIYGYLCDVILYFH